tara:strand:- start:266 stop:517 length:252 start_codon:yes stop_codon:yes gene_type:complete
MIMITKKENKIRWMPPLKQLQDAGLNYHGWIIIDRETWEITNWHTYSDFGADLETLTISKDGETKEIYSTDEGETFTLELREN